MSQELTDTNVSEVVTKTKQKVFNVTRKRQLVKVMKETGNKKTACAAVGITPAHLDKIMAKDHNLYKRFKEAEATYLAELEAEARRRAVDGVEEPVFYKGAVVGYVNKYSDDLLKTLLKAADRDKYGTKTSVENTTTISVKNDELRGKLATALGVTLEEAPTPLEEAVDGEYEEIEGD